GRAARVGRAAARAGRAVRGGVRLLQQQQRDERGGAGAGGCGAPAQAAGGGRRSDRVRPRRRFYGADSGDGVSYMSERRQTASSSSKKPPIQPTAPTATGTPFRYQPP